MSPTAHRLLRGTIPDLPLKDRAIVTARPWVGRSGDEGLPRDGCRRCSAVTRPNAPDDVDHPAYPAFGDFSILECAARSGTPLRARRYRADRRFRARLESRSGGSRRGGRDSGTTHRVARGHLPVDWRSGGRRWVRRRSRSRSQCSRQPAERGATMDSMMTPRLAR